MKVPLLDLDAQYRPIRDEILAAITRVCDSQRFILGPEVAMFEDELARMFGYQHALGVSSGAPVSQSCMQACTRIRVCGNQSPYARVR